MVDDRMQQRPATLAGRLALVGLVWRVAGGPDVPAPSRRRARRQALRDYLLTRHPDMDRYRGTLLGDEVSRPAVPAAVPVQRLAPSSGGSPALPARTAPGVPDGASSQLA